MDINVYILCPILILIVVTKYTNVKQKIKKSVMCVNFDKLVELLTDCVEHEITMQYNYLLNLLDECIEIQDYRLSGINATNKRKDPIYMLELYMEKERVSCFPLLNDFNLWIGFVDDNECIIISLFNMGRFKYPKPGYVIYNDDYSYELVKHTF